MLSGEHVEWFIDLFYVEALNCIEYSGFDG
jgi:hypothetical protein